MNLIYFFTLHFDLLSRIIHIKSRSRIASGRLLFRVLPHTRHNRKPGALRDRLLIRFESTNNLFLLYQTLKLSLIVEKKTTKKPIISANNTV